MKVWPAQLLISALVAMPAASAPTRPWTPLEVAQIERLPFSGPALLPRHETVVISSDDRRASPYPNPPPELGSHEAQQLHLTLCHAEFVALARARAPLARLNAAGTMIYAKVDFELLDVIKRPPAPWSGDTVSLLRRGGSLMSDGQWLRVHDEPAFIEGQDYLLLLTRPDPQGPLLLAQHQQLRVSDGLLQPQAQRWFHVEGRTPYVSVRADITRLLTLACP